MPQKNTLIIMRCLTSLALLTMATLASGRPLLAQTIDEPAIEDITTNLADYAGGQVPLYEKFEITFGVTGLPPDLNAFDPDEIRADGHFTSPSGTVVHPGFLYQDFEVSGIGGSEIYTPVGDPVWMIRFSPQESGIYTYSIEITGSVGTASSAVASFEAVDSDNPGFIGVSDQNSRYFAFSNGDPFIGAGLNVSWWQQEARRISTYDYYLNRMNEFQANLARVWMTNSGIDQDWILSIQDSVLGSDYNLEEAWAFDYILDRAAQKGVYFLLTLDDVNQYTYNWPTQNLYNSALGGPCDYRSAIFTDPDARRFQQRIFRYVIARWGYSPNILSWELFNEINELEWSDGQHWNRQAMIAWHQQMAQYMQSIDAHGHLTNTSTGSFKVHPDLYEALAEMEFAQIHFYYVPGWPWHPSDPAGQDMAALTRYYAQLLRGSVTNEPSVIGEWGLLNEHWVDSPYLDGDDQGIHLHNGLWSSLMSGMATTGLSWHWTHHRTHDTAWWSHYSAVSEFLADIDVSGLSVMQPVNAGLPSARQSPLFLQGQVELSSSDFSSDNDQLRAMGLRRGTNMVYAWVQNLESTWWNYVQASPPHPQSGIIDVLGLSPESDYQIERWDPYTGSVVGTETVLSSPSGSLPLRVTSLTSDIAFRITKASPVSPLAVDISGPATGAPLVSHTFSAAITPVTATQPITYVWQATALSAITHTAGVIDTISFSWSSTGSQTIAVSAANRIGGVTATHWISITDDWPPPGYDIYLPVLMSGYAGDRGQARGVILQ